MPKAHKKNRRSKAKRARRGRGETLMSLLPNPGEPHALENFALSLLNETGEMTQKAYDEWIADGKRLETEDDAVEFVRSTFDINKLIQSTSDIDNLIQSSSRINKKKK